VLLQSQAVLPVLLVQKLLPDPVILLDLLPLLDRENQRLQRLLVVPGFHLYQVCLGLLQVLETLVVQLVLLVRRTLDLQGDQVLMVLANLVTQPFRCHPSAQAAPVDQQVQGSQADQRLLLVLGLQRYLCHQHFHWVHDCLQSRRVQRDQWDQGTLPILWVLVRLQVQRLQQAQDFQVSLRVLQDLKDPELLALQQFQETQLHLYYQEILSDQRPRVDPDCQGFHCLLKVQWVQLPL